MSAPSDTPTDTPWRVLGPHVLGTDGAAAPRLELLSNLLAARHVHRLVQTHTLAEARFLHWQWHRRVSIDSLIVALGAIVAAGVTTQPYWLFGAVVGAGAAWLAKRGVDISRVTGDELLFELNLAALRLDEALGRTS